MEIVTFIAEATACRNGLLILRIRKSNFLIKVVGILYAATGSILS